jgi:hypothetical protein
MDDACCKFTGFKKCDRGKFICKNIDFIGRTGKCLPSTGDEGDIFLNILHGILYVYKNGSWCVKQHIHNFIVLNEKKGQLWFTPSSQGNCASKKLCAKEGDKLFSSTQNIILSFCKCKWKIVCTLPDGATGATGATGTVGCIDEGTDPVCDDAVVIQDANCNLYKLKIADFKDLLQTCYRDDPTQCAATWAKYQIGAQSRCFLTFPNLASKRWGWSNGQFDISDFEDTGVTLQLWRSAEMCNTNNGDLVGNVTITQVDEQTLHFNIVIINDWYLCGTVSTYVGNAPLPVMANGNQTINPGLFPNQTQIDFTNNINLDYDCPIMTDVDGGIDGAIFILIHASSASS